ncbi:MAG: hypothetical protein HKL85_13275 [Acidimicrobiaceae bacterium]|nr:hypothetical protein [Acidimicrobiaceae bacterium]
MSEEDVRRMVVGMDTNDIVIVGDGERAIAGPYGTCFSGDHGTSITGDHGHSVSGADGHSLTGANGNASSGPGGVSSAGVGGAVRAGLQGVLSLDGRDGDREFTVIANIDPDGGPLPGVAFPPNSGHIVYAAWS